MGRYNKKNPDIDGHILDAPIHPRGAFLKSGSTNMDASAYMTWGAVNGASGYGFRDNAGVMEQKNSGGAWAPFGGAGACNLRLIDTNSMSAGTDAGKNWVAVSIIDSIAIGVESQYTNNDGDSVISIGSGSLHSIIADWGPYQVIAIGINSGYGLQKVDSSIMIGNAILLQNNAIGSTPSDNIMIGNDILGHAPNFNSYYNVIIGPNACHTALMTDADNNVIIGSSIGINIDTAYSNVLIGMGAGQKLTDGNYNVMIGNYPGCFVGQGITTGSFNTLIGNNAGSWLRGDSDSNLCLGNSAGPSTAAEYSNKMWIDNHKSDTPLIYADFVTHTVTINGTLTSTGGGGGGLAHGSLTQLDYASAGHTGFEPTITTLTMAKGGTGKALTASNGGLVWTDTDSMEVLATGNSGVLITSGAGIPSIATNIPTAITIGSAYIYRAGGTDIPVVDGGTGLSTVASGSVLVANTVDVVSALTWASAGTKMLVNTSGVLSMETVTGTGAPVLATSPTLISSINVEDPAKPANLINILTNGNYPGFRFYSANDSTYYPSVMMWSLAGTFAVPVATPASRILGSIVFGGYGTAFDTQGAVIDAIAENLWSSGHRETTVRIRTASTGAVSTKLSINSSGTIFIGTETPNANAILDVVSTTKAFMPPRMTTAQKAAIASPTEGMLVYDLTLHKLCVYGAAAWETVTSI